jgi:hypothetical protein
MDTVKTMIEPTKALGTLKDKSRADETQIGGDHYKDFAIQPGEFITRNEIAFYRGCVIKRMCRAGKKGGKDGALEDLRKAMHEIQLIALYEYGEDI